MTATTALQVCQCCTSNDLCGDCIGCLKRVHVNAIFSREDGSEAVTRDVTLEHRNGYVHMRGGPTGYESLPDCAHWGDRDWAACFGTDGRWLRCVVPAAEMDRAYRELGLRP